MDANNLCYFRVKYRNEIKILDLEFQDLSFENVKTKSEWCFLRIFENKKYIFVLHILIKRQYSVFFLQSSKVSIFKL